MGHIINYNECNGKHSLSVQQKPWHGLGQIVQQYPTSTEALQFAGLDYTVEKRELFTFENKNNSANTRKVETIINVPGYCATMRTDNNMVLGVIGKDYDVVQNIDAFAFFDSIIGGEGILYETAEALG